MGKNKIIIFAIAPLKPFKANFNSLLLDFIIDLPKSEDPIIGLNYNIIIIIVDKFLKYLKIFYINKIIIIK